MKLLTVGVRVRVRVIHSNETLDNFKQDHHKQSVHLYFTGGGGRLKTDQANEAKSTES